MGQVMPYLGIKRHSW